MNAHAAACQRLLAAMRDHGWHSLEALGQRLEESPQRVAFLFGELRRASMGSHIISCRKEGRGYTYRLDDPK